MGSFFPLVKKQKRRTYSNEIQNGVEQLTTLGRYMTNFLQPKK